MTDRPIIFSAPMVRALLAGRKTMTRRLAWRPTNVVMRGLGESDTRAISNSLPTWRPELTGDGDLTFRAPTAWRRVKPGDRLWVRESLKHVTSDPVTAEPCSMHCYMASIPAGMDSANPYEDNYLFPEEGDVALKPRSVPSIHMPRWASRLTLIVCDTKIERLQDIDSEDVEAEGVKCDMSTRGFVDHFRNLWERLHGPGSWAANPEVIAISFRVIKANIDAPEALAA